MVRIWRENLNLQGSMGRSIKDRLLQFSRATKNILDEISPEKLREINGKEWSHSKIKQIIHAKKAGAEAAALNGRLFFFLGRLPIDLLRKKRVLIPFLPSTFILAYYAVKYILISRNTPAHFFISQYALLLNA